MKRKHLKRGQRLRSKTHPDQSQRRKAKKKNISMKLNNWFNIRMTTIKGSWGRLMMDELQMDPQLASGTEPRVEMKPIVKYYVK
jgi:hypothetical protein